MSVTTIAFWVSVPVLSAQITLADPARFAVYSLFVVYLYKIIISVAAAESPGAARVLFAFGYLSLYIPSDSTMGIFLTIALLRAIRMTPRASVTVTTIGRPYWGKGKVALVAKCHNKCNIGSQHVHNTLEIIGAWRTKHE
jgi:hypothetical protein